MRKCLAAIAIVISLAISGMPLSTADMLIFATNSSEDRKQPVDMNYRYEPMGISVNVMDSNKGEIIIKANFSSALSPTSFMNYGGAQPLLRLKILNTLTTFKGDNGYIWLEAPNNQPYQGSTRIDAVSSIYSDPKVGPSAGRKSLAYCNPKTWMDSGGSSGWVAFSIDRNCADINDMFWVVGYMDSDIWNSTYMYDSKYFPLEPFLVNMGSVPRPPKMKDQIVVMSPALGNQRMEIPEITTKLTSSMGLPVLVTSLTPSVCIATINGTTLQISLKNSGTCSLDAYAPGSSLVNPSPHVQYGFYVAPYVKQYQQIYRNVPTSAQVGDSDYELYFEASSRLPVSSYSVTPSVCNFENPSTRPLSLSILEPGVCEIRADQAGSERWYPESIQISFYVNPAPKVKPTPSPAASTSKPKPTPTPSVIIGGGATAYPTTQGPSRTLKPTVLENTKTTITCVRTIMGKTQKQTISKVNPKCPSGWKKK